MAISVLTQIQSSVEFQVEAGNLFCSARQMTGFYMKRNTGLK